MDAKKFRWPWEKIVNKSMEGIFEKPPDENDSDEENEHENDERQNKEFMVSTSKSYDNDLLDKFKARPKRSPKNIKLSSQKFAYNKNNGFIYSIDNPNLVFGIIDAEANLIEVVLMKRNDDNVNQRWIYKQNGAIISKARSNMALSIKLPFIDMVDIDLYTIESEEKRHIKRILNEASIVLQPYIESEFGNANQRWLIDDSIGFIYAFSVENEMNIEITAANKANICSYYISYDKEISQPVSYDCKNLTFGLNFIIFFLINKGYLCELGDLMPDRVDQEKLKKL